MDSGDCWKKAKVGDHESFCRRTGLRDDGHEKRKIEYHDVTSRRRRQEFVRIKSFFRSIWSVQSTPGPASSIDDGSKFNDILSTVFGARFFGAAVNPLCAEDGSHANDRRQQMGPDVYPCRNARLGLHLATTRSDASIDRRKPF